MDKRGGAEVDLDGLNTKASSDSFVERQQALDEFLDKSAKNQLLEYDPADFVEFFKALYSPKSPDERFRHKYASIFKILEDNSVSQAGNQPPGVVADGVVDYLSSVKDAIPDDAEGKAAKQGLFKLIDHINLESQRMTSSYNRSDSLGNSVTAIAERAETINEQIGSLEQKQEELKKKQEELASNAQNAQRDNVAILGIFAAIVIAFATGTGFAVSSMQVALRARDLFALGFIVSLVGLVLLVVMQGLFSYLKCVGVTSQAGANGARLFNVGSVLLAVLSGVCLFVMLLNSDSYIGGALRAAFGFPC